VAQQAVQQEIHLANDKHLLVARNLETAFSRYVFDVKAAFQLSISAFYSGDQAPGLQDLLNALVFRHVCIVNGETGEVERYMPGFAEPPNGRFVLNPETLRQFREQLKNDQIVITDLGRDVAGNPAFFLLKAMPDGRIAYGAVGTNYLIELQRKIAFGARGHAAVLDRSGKVIAHPFQHWIDSQFDLSKIPPAVAIRAGQSGVMQFYSPAYKADMITAFTTVPETGWGVMVPQPMEELYAQAREVGRAAAAIGFLSLVAAGLISWLLAKSISRPLKAVTVTAGAIAGGDRWARAPNFAPYVPSELRLLSASFNRMLDEQERKNRELEDTAVRANAANRAKSEFLANVSHELRTPLNAILGFSEIMRDQVLGPMPNPRYRGYATDINDSALHLIDVINDILDLSRAEAGQISVTREPVDLRDLCESAVRLIEAAAGKKEIEITVELDPEVANGVIETDAGKLRQIIVNLLSNAIKFTEPKGLISLSARPIGNDVEITVSDTGIGIARSDIDKVLTPFGQVQDPYEAQEGFGLGLPLSKKLAEALGGKLSLVSKPGEGTTVTVGLPRCEAAVPPVIPA
jgi:signal transduction histidine kinase